MTSSPIRKLGIGRLVAAAASTVTLLAIVLATFWYQDWQYSLPTPRPPDLREVPVGTIVDVARIVGPAFAGRPVAIHVVNPDCPCSRFNRDHVRTLARRYGGRVTFVALVQGSDDPDALVRSFDSWGVPMTVVADPGGRRAADLGAYSTPQSVIVDDAGRLFYRGNYNLSRYCVDERTEFARLAIEALVGGRPLPAMPAEATTAYGCPLPPRSGNAETD